MKYTEGMSQGMSRLALRVALGILASVGAIGSAPAQIPASGPLDPPSTVARSDRAVSLRKFPENLLADQKEIWLFPLDVVHGKHIWPTVGVLGVTAGLVASDAHTAPPFRTTTDFSGFNQAFSSANTAAMLAAVPAALYGVGWFRHDPYAQDSALLAAEAFVDGFLVDLPLKAITARRPPLSYSGSGPYTGSFWNGSHNPFHQGGFYSGHAMAATAVAAVLAHRYRQHRWVPYLAYGMAGVISFSRITTSNHFPGDVFLGGAVGFVVARYVVLPAR